MLVSVVMITYGQEKYIRQAIDGVLMQRTNFKIELIVSNDASPDNTNSIIEHYIKTHPKAGCINYTNQKKNIGMMPNFEYGLQNCTGTYIAMCEGDDYWTDPYKLQKQVDFLEANPEYVLCFHKIKILKPDGSLVPDFITKVPEDYETQETLARLGNYIHTPSVVFRNIIKEFPKEFSLAPIGDYFLYMLLTEHGKIKYIEDEMAVYRYGVGVLSNNQNNLKLKKWIDCLVLIMCVIKNETVKNIFYDRYKSAINQLYNLSESNKKSNFHKLLKRINHRIFFRNKP